MRKIVSAILILFVFLSLQFGKVATYLWCKWQLEIVQNQSDCGCDSHLADMFNHDNTAAKNSLAKITLNEKITEFSSQPMVFNLSAGTEQKKSCFAEYDSPLLKSFIASLFRPPAV